MVTDEMLKSLPNDPGVYIMKDKNGKIIYVGKAKVLKNRVKQYFQNIEKHTPKVLAMVKKVDTFQYIITDSELEALILECNLIKKHKPFYNILLKDDKNYPYIKVTTNEDFPQIKFVRKMQKDGAKYFGPFSSGMAVREAIDTAQKLFKIPSCHIRLPRDMGKKRACINAQIGRCCAPCENILTKEEYNLRIKDACTFFEGGAEEIIKDLTDKMITASSNLEFERAASIRDEINGLKQIEKKQKIVSDKHSDEDILGFFSQNNKTFAAIFFVRQGRLIGTHNTVMNNTSELTDADIAEIFIKQFYEDADFIPKNVYIQYELENNALLSEYLTEISGKTVKIHTPKRAEKKALVDMANKNAKQAALNYMLKHADGDKNLKRIILDLKENLGLKKPPYRIESYDISNISGEDNVGSMIVFVNGEPKKKFYRRFKIEVALGGDDYASMSEMILRRLIHANDEQKKVDTGELSLSDAKFLPLPDCIFLDGGKGHINAISKVLEITDTDIPIFGMVKDNKHKTRALLTSDGKQVDLKPKSEEFKLITHIQEEVHRFAIEYHKTVRNKKMKSSSLENIDGVGKQSAIKLLKHFGSIKAIKNADVEEIKKAGVNIKIAEKVYVHFKNKT